MTSVWTCFWAAMTLIFAFAAVAQWTGLEPNPDYDVAMGGVIIAIFGIGMTVCGVWLLRGRALRQPLGAAASLSHRVVKPPSLPRAGSVARGPMRRLAEAEGALAQVLYQLDEPSAESAVPQDWIAATRDVAAHAAAELRATATRLEAVELGMRHAASADRESLETEVRGLREKLGGGLDAYGTLISAACRVLIAQAPTGSRADLTDATDRLAALATALRELPPPE
jgi:hypothetical protein